jgi:hypothetical protein
MLGGALRAKKKGNAMKYYRLTSVYAKNDYARIDSLSKYDKSKLIGARNGSFSQILNGEFDNRDIYRSGHDFFYFSDNAKQIIDAIAKDYSLFHKVDLVYNGNRVKSHILETNTTKLKFTKTEQAGLYDINNMYIKDFNGYDIVAITNSTEIIISQKILDGFLTNNVSGFGYEPIDKVLVNKQGLPVSYYKLVYGPAPQYLSCMTKESISDLFDTNEDKVVEAEIRCGTKLADAINVGIFTAVNAKIVRIIEKNANTSFKKIQISIKCDKGDNMYFVIKPDLLYEKAKYNTKNALLARYLAAPIEIDIDNMKSPIGIKNTYMCLYDNVTKNDIESYTNTNIRFSKIKIINYENA